MKRQARTPRTGRPRSVFVNEGERYGRGVVIDEVRVYRADGTSRRGAKMLCDCGNEYTAEVSQVAKLKTTSCGCARDDAARHNSPYAVTHGLTDHEHYGRWRQMIDRCTRPEHHSYRYYGNRGVTVHPLWHDPAIFIGYLETMLLPRPPRYTLDRIDPYGNYEPGNIRWASPREQRLNQRARIA